MIAVCTNPYRDMNLTMTRRAAALLQDAGYEICVCPVFSEELGTAEDLPVQRLRDAVDRVDRILVLGGDGTILAVVRELGEAQRPILGVNLGTMGFMTALEPEELERVPEAFRPGVPVTGRMMLDVTLMRNGEPIVRDTALNDAVLHGYGEVIRPTAWSEGNKMFSFSGDGLIVATPTGSTGYSMSAGGPIVEPDAQAIILTPICAHTLRAKPFVLAPERRVRILTEKLTGRRAYLAVDGYQVADLESGDVLEVRASEKRVSMIEPAHRSFYEQLEKLS